MAKIKYPQNPALGTTVNAFPKVQYAKVKEIIDVVNTEFDGTATPSVDTLTANEVILNKGTVTQKISITNGVTINKAAGTITTVSSTIAHDAAASFTVTNSYAKSDSVIVVSAKTAGAGIPVATVDIKTNGSFGITLINAASSAAFNDTISIDFIIV